MPLDPQAKAMLDAMPAMPDFATLDLALVRAGMAHEPVRHGRARAPLAKVENRTIPGPAGEIPRARLHARGNGPVPRASCIFHGGGFVLCSLDTHDGICRSLANAAGCVVVSVDYRLAPEHRYPGRAGGLLCGDAVGRQARRRARHRRHAPRGRRRQRGRQPHRGDRADGARPRRSGAALPAADLSGHRLRVRHGVVPRQRRRATSSPRSMMRWFWDQYLADPKQAREALRVAAARARPVADLPPGLCITAEYDPLRDEGEAYAARLRSAGIDCRTSRYDGHVPRLLRHDARSSTRRARRSRRRAPRCARRWPRRDGPGRARAHARTQARAARARAAVHGLRAARARRARARGARGHGGGARRSCSTRATRARSSTW